MSILFRPRHLFHPFAEERESLQFKLSAFKDYESSSAATRPDDDNLGAWGHEFVRSLAGGV